MLGRYIGMRKIELLAPAKDLEFGREAVNHGADALYIGAPAFGARAAATNSIEDIEALVQYAHLYGCKVYATVNTILFDDELERAVAMIHRLYNIGLDALIVQDMGLLECNLPPIELHASTQCHNATPERVRFLEQAGFTRVILARETSLVQMQTIRKASNVELEAFVHGALCVSYSGQCYMSQYLTGRSGNRGCCSQPCRSAYDLYTSDGRTLLKNRHLLSLKDFNASKQIDSMISAGISSFKIEGRLKDLSYVKNVTAHYRQLLDAIIERNAEGENALVASSSGKCTYTFTPDVERTFNRGYTDYFLRERQPMASFATQKSIGKEVGKVTSVGSRTLTVGGGESFANGDGLCYIDANGRMQGFLVNDVQGCTLTPNTMPPIKVGTTLWRNNDILFEKRLNGSSAERKIGIEIIFKITQGGFALDIKDEDGVAATAQIITDHNQAVSHAKMSGTIVKQLSKLGGTPYRVDKIVDATGGQYFIPALMLNELRRNAIKTLNEYRIKHFHPTDHLRVDNMAAFPASSVDYRANVVNSRAEDFYKKHGAKVMEHGVEQTHDYAGKALMTTKYCLRYELGCCLLGKSKTTPAVEIKPDDGLILHNNGQRFRLHFDCTECRMQILPEG